MSKDTEYPVIDGLNEDVAAVSFISLRYGKDEREE